ncbi:hypothetical protein SUGI_0117810 [Cryptomeria japonica]|nr:hypothetical protein SUGI_0117810 [Cryptomeria japonica]
MDTRGKVLILVLVGVSLFSTQGRLIRWAWLIVLVGGISSNVAELERERWREKLLEVVVPQTLLARLSPLSLTQIHNLAMGLKKMYASTFNADEFCRCAGLICREDVAFVHQILNLLNIPSELNMSRSMESTLEMCEGRGEEGEVKRCSTSVEGMVEFVMSRLGSKVDLLTDMFVVGSGQRVTVTILRKKLLISCHIGNALL